MSQWKLFQRRKKTPYVLHQLQEIQCHTAVPPAYVLKGYSSESYLDSPACSSSWRFQKFEWSWYSTYWSSKCHNSFTVKWLLITTLSRKQDSNDSGSEKTYRKCLRNLNHVQQNIFSDRNKTSICKDREAVKHWIYRHRYVKCCSKEDGH